MKDSDRQKASASTVLSLAQLLEQQPPTPPPCLVEPGLLPAQGIWFVGGEPKVGKSLLVANLALALAAGSNRIGFSIPAPRRVLVCQFELPLPQFVSRLLIMRRALGAAADHHLLIDTRATGHLLSAPQGLNHFVLAARAAAAEVIVLDPLYSTHDQDENDTRAMAALCQALLRLRDATGAALIVIHHVRKSITREEIGSAFRGSSALHAVAILTRCSPAPPPDCLPSSCAFSFVTAHRSHHDYSNSMPRLSGSPAPAWRPWPRYPVTKWNQPTSCKFSAQGADSFAMASCDTRSCSRRNVPNERRS